MTVESPGDEVADRLEAKARANEATAVKGGRTTPVTDGPDPSSLAASAERQEGKPPPPTQEELEQQHLEAELQRRLYGPQREEDREADRVQVDRLEWVPPEQEELEDGEAAAADWFNRQLR